MKLYVDGELWEVHCPIGGSWIVVDAEARESDVYLYSTGLYCRGCMARRCRHTDVVFEWLKQVR